MPTDPVAASRKYRELVRLLGCRPTPMPFERWLEAIGEAVATCDRQQVFANHNLHSLYQAQRDHGVRAFYARSACCYLDGTYLRWILAAGGVSTTPEERFSLMDRFPDFLEQAVRRGWRVFYLGATIERVDRARQWMRQRWPSLDITLHHGYFEDSQPVVEQINHARPDVLMVGMGSPRQEHWLLHHIDSLDCGIAMQCGGTLDYYTGGQARPPRWMSDAGLGWLYRLLHNPRRMWRRYLLEPWTLLPSVFRLWLVRD